MLPGQLLPTLNHDDMIPLGRPDLPNLRTRRRTRLQFIRYFFEILQ
jgi:hypothetical protein